MTEIRRRILVLSDSHGYNLSTLLMKACAMGKPDAVLHAGDGCRDLERYSGDLPEIYQVSGNCDIFPAAGELCFDLFNLRFLLCHGHRYQVKSTMSLLEDRAHEVGAQVCVFGHTHAPYNETKNGVLYLNPGAAYDRHFSVLLLLGDGSLYARMY